MQLVATSTSCVKPPHRELRLDRHGISSFRSTRAFTNAKVSPNLFQKVSKGNLKVESRKMFKDLRTDFKSSHREDSSAARRREQDRCESFPVPVKETNSNRTLQYMSIVNTHIKLFSYRFGNAANLGRPAVKNRIPRRRLATSSAISCHLQHFTIGKIWKNTVE